MHKHDEDDVNPAGDCGREAGQSLRLEQGCVHPGGSTHPLHSRPTLGCRDNRRVLQGETGAPPASESKLPSTSPLLWSSTDQSAAVNSRYYREKQTNKQTTCSTAVLSTAVSKTMLSMLLAPRVSLQSVLLAKTFHVVSLQLQQRESKRKTTVSQLIFLLNFGSGGWLVCTTLYNHIEYHDFLGTFMPIVNLYSTWKKSIFSLLVANIPIVSWYRKYYSISNIKNCVMHLFLLKNYYLILTGVIDHSIYLHISKISDSTIPFIPENLLADTFFSSLALILFHKLE